MVCLGGDARSVVRLDKGRSQADLTLTGWMSSDADQSGRRQELAIITGAVSEFGRLVVEEYQRRAQRVVVLGQAAPDTELDEATPGADLREADDRYRRGSARGLRREA